MTIGQVLPGIDKPRLILTTCALSAGIGAAMGWRFGWSAPLPAFLRSVGTAVDATDLVQRRVPNQVVLRAYIVGATLLALASATSNRWSVLVRAGAVVLVLAALLVVLALTAPGGIGLGDCKRAGVVGLYLGWLGWAALSTGTLLAFVAAALFVIGRRVVSSPGHRMLLPFAPFMASGALIAILAIR